jgi:hypothetical protein
MHAKGYMKARSPAVTFAAAAIAGFAALTLLWGTVSLFQGPSVRVEQAVAASRACAHHAHQPEREVCIRQWLAGSQPNWRTNASR